TKARPSLVFLINAISSLSAFISAAALARASSARAYHCPPRYACRPASCAYSSSAPAARAEIGATAAWFKNVHAFTIGNSAATLKPRGSGGKEPQFTLSMACPAQNSKTAYHENPALDAGFSWYFTYDATITLALSSSINAQPHQPSRPVARPPPTSPAHSA